MRGRSLSRKQKGPRKGSLKLKQSGGVLFSQYNKPRTWFNKWLPTDYINWLRLMRHLGPITPARDYCNEEPFMSYAELVESKEAYLAALRCYFGERRKPEDPELEIEISSPSRMES